ncbi:ABC transporter permease, partial [Bifidobacterium breve]|nr:ABC transporter permease [Bifidobacterium breve]
LFEASKVAAASASDMDANQKVAVIDTASADAESASDTAVSGFGNTMKTALYSLFLAMTVCGSLILGTFTTGEVR